MTPSPAQRSSSAVQSASELLPPPLAVHQAGETALLAEYPDTVAVLAAAAAVRALAPPHLLDLVPAERTLLLRGTASRDVPAFAELLTALPRLEGEGSEAREVRVDVVYDGEDLDDVATVLGLTREALVSAHSSAVWTAAFGGFAPGFAYLLPEDASVGPPWEVPRRAEPRTAVPAGAVGLASRYCGIYPRSSPGGWQLIGRSDAPLFEVDREPPALLIPGTRVRFSPQRTISRSSAMTAAALSRAAREAAAVRARLARRRTEVAVADAREAFEVLSPGPLALVQDSGRPGQAAIGVSPSGAFDQGALLRANLAVGNPSGAAALEVVAGPLLLRAVSASVVALAGAFAPVSIHHADPELVDVHFEADAASGRALALDPGDRLEVGLAASGLRLVLALRGGIRAVRPADGSADAAGTGAAGSGAASAGVAGTVCAEVLGASSRDTLSGLGPAPLRTGDLLLVGPGRGLEAVPEAEPVAQVETESEAELDAGDKPLEIPVHLGPRHELLGAEAVSALLETTWTVRPDSDRVGVRLDGPALPVPDGAGTVPSEPMLPGAVQVPPSGLPVVFGPDHPTTGGYPAIAVVTRQGLDALAQAAAGTTLRFVDAAVSAS